MNELEEKALQVIREKGSITPMDLLTTLAPTEKEIPAAEKVIQGIIRERKATLNLQRFLVPNRE